MPIASRVAFAHWWRPKWRSRDNALHSQEAQALQEQLAHERDRLQLLLEITDSVIANLELATSYGLSRRPCGASCTVMPWACSCWRRGITSCASMPSTSPTARASSRRNPDPLEGSLSGKAFQTGKPVVVDRRLCRGELSDRW